MEADVLERLAGPTTAGHLRRHPANLLRLARTRAELSQREVARRAEVAESTIQRIEAGTMQPTMLMLSQILLAMGQEMRIQIAPFDDHDMVLDKLEASRPEDAVAAAAARKDFVTKLRNGSSDVA